MKKYKVTIYNGGYALTRECESISEAYGTMKAYEDESRQCVDLDDLICALGDMHHERAVGYHRAEFWVDTVNVDDAEA